MRRILLVAVAVAAIPFAANAQKLDPQLRGHRLGETMAAFMAKEPDAAELGGIKSGEDFYLFPMTHEEAAVDQDYWGGAARFNNGKLVWIKEIVNRPCPKILADLEKRFGKPTAQAGSDGAMTWMNDDFAVLEIGTVADCSISFGTKQQMMKPEPTVKF